MNRLTFYWCLLVSVSVAFGQVSKKEDVRSVCYIACGSSQACLDLCNAQFTKTLRQAVTDAYCSLYCNGNPDCLAVTCGAGIAPGRR